MKSLIVILFLFVGLPALWIWDLEEENKALSTRVAQLKIELIKERGERWIRTN